MKKWLLGNEETAKRSGVIWNLIASVINASEAVLILAIASRTIGIEESGTYTIGFALANLMMCVGKYGVRNYQVTDVLHEYNFREYRISRIITVSLMLLGTALYVLPHIIDKSYTLEKTLIIVFFSVIYAIEAYEDVYLAAFQNMGRLDIGTKMFSLRWFIILLVWSVMLWLTSSAFNSLLFALIIGIIVELFLLMLVRNNIQAIGEAPRNNQVKKIMKTCFPLCIISTLSIYMPNAARYAIDYFGTEKELAYYGYIAMPVFAIDLLCFVIFQPLMVDLAKTWKDDKKKFSKMTYRMSWIVLAVSCISLVLAYFLGIPILSILYSARLEFLKSEFMVLMIGGSFLAYIGWFSSLLTIMRKQKYLIVPYATISILVFLTLLINKCEYGIMGTAIINSAGIALLAIILGAICVLFINKNKKEA